MACELPIVLDPSRPGSLPWNPKPGAMLRVYLALLGATVRLGLFRSPRPCRPLGAQLRVHQLAPQTIAGQGRPAGGTAGGTDPRTP
jgi:hypothetical protein